MNDDVTVVVTLDGPIIVQVPTTPSPVIITTPAAQGPQGIKGEDGDFPPGASLELAWDQHYPSNYSETTYLAAKIQKVDIWNSPAKTTLVITKEYFYTGDLITGVLVTNHVLGSTMTKTVTYNAGIVSSVNRIFTE